MAFGPASIERHLAAHHWPLAWREAMHPFHHFHASTREALGIAQ